MAGRATIVAASAVVVLALPAADGATDEITGAAARITATQRLLDSVIYDKTTGSIENIDRNRNTFQLEGKTFSASPTNTVGTKLFELKAGDRVTVEATDIQTSREPVNVMILQKVE
jgi:hypothetical protein